MEILYIKSNIFKKPDVLTLKIVQTVKWNNLFPYKNTHKTMYNDTEIALTVTITKQIIWNTQNIKAVIIDILSQSKWVSEHKESDMLFMIW